MGNICSCGHQSFVPNTNNSSPINSTRSHGELTLRQSSNRPPSSDRSLSSSSSGTPRFYYPTPRGLHALEQNNGSPISSPGDDLQVIHSESIDQQLEALGYSNWAYFSTNSAATTPSPTPSPIPRTRGAMVCAGMRSPDITDTFLNRGGNLLRQRPTGNTYRGGYSGQSSNQR